MKKGTSLKEVPFLYVYYSIFVNKCAAPGCSTLRAGTRAQD